MSLATDIKTQSNRSLPHDQLISGLPARDRHCISPDEVPDEARPSRSIFDLLRPARTDLTTVLYRPDERSQSDKFKSAKEEVRNHPRIVTYESQLGSEVGRLVSASSSQVDHGNRTQANIDDFTRDMLKLARTISRGSENAQYSESKLPLQRVIVAMMSPWGIIFGADQQGLAPCSHEYLSLHRLKESDDKRGVGLFVGGEDALANFQPSKNSRTVFKICDTLTGNGQGGAGAIEHLVALGRGNIEYKDIHFLTLFADPRGLEKIANGYAGVHVHCVASDFRITQRPREQLGQLKTQASLFSFQERLEQTLKSPSMLGRLQARGVPDEITLNFLLEA